VISPVVPRLTLNVMVTDPLPPGLDPADRRHHAGRQQLRAESDDLFRRRRRRLVAGGHRDGMNKRQAGMRAF
jgi:hypothetical protein